ncbi:MAG: transglutaminase domain-containing protein [Acidobacteriota bacterium]|nr:transglutaminase domain-containing protein [Acidobacteriota bacterium]
MLILFVLFAAFPGGPLWCDESETAPAEDSLEAIPNPLEATVAMGTWARQRTRGLTDRLQRLQALHRPFVRPGPAFIEEITGPTPTARQAFETRRSDCVGFALLLSSLARELDIELRFVLAGQVATTDRSGTLEIQRGHLAVLFEGRVFDLAGEEAYDPQRHWTISRRTALALYHSNRGAQRLAQGSAAEAVEILWRALRLDPSLGTVWSNLGVALRRSGDTAGAVLAHEMALRIDPADPGARRNLGIACAEPLTD